MYFGASTRIHVDNVAVPLYRQTIPSFTHLLGYGANYYSYLWCQGLASMLWQHCFQDDPLNSDSGRR